MVQTFFSALNSPLPHLPVVSGQEEAGWESVPFLAHADVELLSAVILFGRREGQVAGYELHLNRKRLEKWLNLLHEYRAGPAICRRILLRFVFCEGLSGK